MKNFNFSFKLKSASIIVSLILAINIMNAQNDVMMQAFYWDVPTNETAKDGFWWDTLASKACDWKADGITGIWIPSPCKGNYGIYDMGYGIYDHYDLGNYYQKNTTETRFGSRQELEDMIADMHAGATKIDIYADIILNHIYGGDDNFEANPAVKAYTFGEAHGGANVAYQTNDIKWIIPNATPGDYYIQIKGFNISGEPGYNMGYEVNIDWDGTQSGNRYWETEPNNGMGTYNVVGNSGDNIQALYDWGGTIDEFKVTVSSTHDIVIKIQAMKQKTSGSWPWEWANQTNGYYPVAIWYNGSNLAGPNLEAHTRTNCTYVTHTGTGEPNYSWNYSHFHPVDEFDWLGDGGYQDAIVTNTRWFGNDFNTFSTTVQNRLNDWGEWLVNQIGFDGFRMDFVRGFQVEFLADWITNLPLKDGSQRFIVGEYWTEHAYRLKDWVTDLDTEGADATVFDFPLRMNLQRMCNGDQNSYNMAWLNHASMYRTEGGNNLPAESIVQFVDNHDTGKEHDKWITQDFKMAYAYMLTHPGRPCLFYPHYYSITQHDHGDPSKTTTAPVSLRDDINKLIYIRKTYLDGDVEVLSEVGSPWPSGDTQHVYIARRQGNGTKSGAIVVLNNHDSSTKGLWVNSSPAGFANWAGTTLVNALNPSETTYVYPDGRVWISAPSRGFKVFVKQSEYQAYTKSAAVANAFPEVTKKDQIDLTFFPQPAGSVLHFNLNLDENGDVMVELYNIQGMLADVLINKNIPEGNHRFTFDISDFEPGIYFANIKIGNNQMTEKIIIK